MKALRFERSLARFAAARVAGTLAPGRGRRVGPLRLVDVDQPSLPGPDWHVVRPRLAGICGSDLATVDGMSSRYFEPIVSFPFIPGHEVVGELDDGTRVVVEPVLALRHPRHRPAVPLVRGGPDQPVRAHRLRPPRARPAERLLRGHRRRLVDGAWSPTTSQLHRVPDDLTDEAGGDGRADRLRRARRRRPPRRRAHRRARRRHPRALHHRRPAQQRRAAGPRSSPSPSTPSSAAWPSTSAPTWCAEPGELRGRRAPARPGRCTSATRSSPAAPTTSSTASAAATRSPQSLQVVAPGGQIHLVGMPATVSVDLTGLWHREVSITGRYAYTHAEFERRLRRRRATPASAAS